MRARVIAGFLMELLTAHMSSASASNEAAEAGNHVFHIVFTEDGNLQIILDGGSR